MRPQLPQVSRKDFPPGPQQGDLRGLPACLAEAKPTSQQLPRQGSEGQAHLVTMYAAKQMTKDPMKMPICLAATSHGASAH